MQHLVSVVSEDVARGFSLNAVQRAIFTLQIISRPTLESTVRQGAIDDGEHVTGIENKRQRRCPLDGGFFDECNVSTECI